MSILNENVSIPGDKSLKPTDPQAFRDIVNNRRSVRLFTNEPIPETVVRDCLDLALLAPNSSNLQCWEFYWVRSPEKKKQMVDICLGQNAARTAAEIIVCVGRIDKIRWAQQSMLGILRKQPSLPKSVFAYYEKLVPFVYSKGPLSVMAPIKWIMFTLAGLFKPVPREPLGRNDLRLWAAKSTALACENLMLAFSAHGYDTCPMEGLDSARVKSLLGLPRSAVVVMAIGAGKRNPDGVFGDRVRFPKENFVKEV